MRFLSEDEDASIGGPRRLCQRTASVTCGGVSRGPGGGRGGPHAPDPHHDPSGRMLSCHPCGPSGRPGGGLAERPRRQDCTARARTSGRSRQGRRGRQRSLRLRPLHLAHFQVPGGRQAFCGPLRRPDRRCPVRDAAGPGGQPGAGRGQRDWPWPAWSPAGPGAACSRSGRRLRAGTGARSLSWGSRGAGWGGRMPEPRSRRVFPGLEGRLGLASAPGDATRPPASWNRGQGRAALGAVKSGRVW